MASTRYISAPSDDQITTSLEFDYDAIPQAAWDGLAAATMDLIHAILRQPGGLEALDARTAARKAAQAAQRKEQSL